MSKSNRPLHPIKWEQRPAAIREEIERRERENSPHVVRVVYDFLTGDAAIYREGRMGLKHQELTAEQKQIMLDAGEDEKVFYYALWSQEETKWKLLERAPKSEGW